MPGRIVLCSEQASRTDSESSSSGQLSCLRFPPPHSIKYGKFQICHPNSKHGLLPCVRSRTGTANSGPRIALLQQISAEAKPIECTKRHTKKIWQMKPDSGIREKQQTASAAENQAEHRPLRQRRDDQEISAFDPAHQFVVAIFHRLTAFSVSITNESTQRDERYFIKIITGPCVCFQLQYLSAFIF